MNNNRQALSYRLPSFGTFSTNLNPIYSFGVPRQVKMSGIMVDMDAVTQSLWTKDNEAQMVKTLVQQIGMMTSVLEHRIPELLFTNEENPGEAVSAVKALALASAQGQRIYQITSENVNVVLPQLTISSEVKDEIRASVTVGKVATVSQNNITVGGWTGVGYIIADAETGAGAYRISGGGNGGWLVSAITGTLAGLAAFLTALGSSPNPFLQGTIPAVAAFIIFLGLAMDNIMKGDSYAERFNLASIFLTFLDAILVVAAVGGLVTVSGGVIIALLLATLVTTVMANALAFIMLPLKQFLVYHIQNDKVSYNKRFFS